MPKSPTGQSGVLTMTEAARFLRISRAYLSKIINHGVPGLKPPPYARVGRRLLFTVEGLMRWFLELESFSTGVL